MDNEFPSNEYGTEIPSMEEGGRDNKIWIILAVVVAVLCCCCVVVSLLFYFFLGDPLMEIIEDFSWLPSVLAVL